jgi:ribosomal protein L21E
MREFEEGDRVRVDIPDVTDPDHEQYHGEHGTVLALIEDDAEAVTGREQDSILLRVELDNDETADFRRRDLRPPLE